MCAHMCMHVYIYTGIMQLCFLLISQKHNILAIISSKLANIKYPIPYTLKMLLSRTSRKKNVFTVLKLNFSYFYHRALSLDQT